MRPVTSVQFDRDERQVLQRVEVWSGLLRDAPELEQQAGILRRIGQRAPEGQSRKHLLIVMELLQCIRRNADEDRQTWTAIAEQAPEEDPRENALITRPKEAATTIVEAREQAMRDVDAALAIILEALKIATEPVDDSRSVGA